MFETSERKSLSEDLFDEWLEKGRTNMLGHQFILITWNELDQEYSPVFSSSREELYGKIGSLPFHEVSLAAYDIFSGSRIQIDSI